MKKIILTGGGTAGHVTPNLALIPKLNDEGYKIYYIGGKKSIEEELVAGTGVPYYSISSGKLRRYLDLKNVTDAFKVVKGIGDAFSLVKKLKPDVVFSKGGFVSVPVVVAAKLCGSAVVIHESDTSPGLANKLSTPFADAVCVSFPETLSKFHKNKAVLTGTPIRAQLFEGSREEGRAICGFSGNKPVVLFMGGSLGSRRINECLREALPRLLKSFNIVHLCGKGNVDVKSDREGYKQFEYLSGELPHIMALSDIVVSRSGANSISEFLALKKPSLLIPLSKKASRGDQILNAESFRKQGFAKLMYEEDMNADSLVTEIIELYANRDAYVKKMADSRQSDGVNEVIGVIKRISC